jgi:hypothetical protein
MIFYFATMCIVFTHFFLITKKIQNNDYNTGAEFTKIVSPSLIKNDPNPPFPKMDLGFFFKKDHILSK